MIKAKSKNSDPQALFFRLTIRLELFTQTVPVPAAVYFTIITGSFYNDQAILVALVCGLISGALMVILGSFWRFWVINHIVSEIAEISHTRLSGIKKREKERVFGIDKGLNDRIRQIKIKLIRHPFNEARMIILRWLVGVPLAHGLFAISEGFQTINHLSLPFLLLLIVPISYVAYLFTSENVIRPYLRAPLLRYVKVDIQDMPRIAYFQRLLLAIGALVLLPLVMLGYVFFAQMQGYIKLGNPFVHIFIMILIMPFPILFTAYHVSKAVRQGLHDIGFVLNRLGRGIFFRAHEPHSADEFGRQSHHLNQVIDKLRNMYEQINDLNVNLERKVARRTQELRDSLHQIQDLKAQQDGDYFLTSLLLKPLNYNHATSNRAKVDFFIKQKKAFSFRQWHEEIGGDLCCAADLQLRKKRYLVFANADAMGKSIQGAGGALVFGSVFQALIERTKMLSGRQSYYPEKWLRQAFLELHKVLEGFNGSMLVSAVIGLVDGETGLVYFMNAEHPHPILYRQGIANFVPEAHSFRKLGTTGVRGKIFIQTVQLNPGDSLWIGSDGKDDIILRQDDQGRQINEDEKLFLRIIEKVDGDIEKIYEATCQYGETSDDLSILRIQYLPPGYQVAVVDETSQICENQLSAIFTSNKPKHFLEKLDQYRQQGMLFPWSIRKLEAQAFFQLGNFTKAAFCAQEFVESNPADSEMQYLAIMSWMRNKNYKKAIAAAERLCLREPNNEKYLRILGRLYLLIGNFNGEISEEN